MARDLPLLLLDVDGVLNPFAGDQCPVSYQEFQFFPGEAPVRLCPAHADWLRELGERFEMVWATGWGAEANRLLAPVLRLPQLPVIGLPPGPFEPREKVPAVAAYVGSRPVAWIDDALTTEARAWAEARAAPTLLVDIDPAEGLSLAVVRRLLAWSQGLPSPTDSLRRRQQG
ncbi:HAD domain-containing protein [Micromonospora sp. NPDC023814]|uniref:HAD domain-containing protein n=1 Tax=Micromonospora sp. NPDC023814 TaxID=3154596 RepID=UPI0033EC1EB5